MVDQSGGGSGSGRGAKCRLGFYGSVGELIKLLQTEKTGATHSLGETVVGEDVQVGEKLLDPLLEGRTMENVDATTTTTESVRYHLRAQATLTARRRWVRVDVGRRGRRGRSSRRMALIRLQVGHPD